MTPVLELTSRCTADAYVFHPVKGADGRRDHGWAICTVNDASGELLVCSDWGNAIHRWDTGNLGAPTLTAFIAARGEVDYLARKLTIGRRDVFSSSATVRAMKSSIRERRREGSITKSAARAAWLDLDDLESLGDGERAAGEFSHMVGESVADVLPSWHDFYCTETTSEFRALSDFILPALVKACSAEIAKRVAP